MRIEFTEHAILRFIERHAPQMSMEEARDYLSTAASGAVRLKAKTIRGQTQWHIPANQIVLVTKPDGQEHVCVTILPHKENVPRTPTEEELLELMFIEERSAEERKATRKVEAAPSSQAINKKDPERAEKLRLFSLRGRDLSRVLQILMTQASNTKQYEKTKRHLDNNQRQYNQTKNLLRLALRYIKPHIKDDIKAKEVWDKISETEPGLVSTDFLTMCGRMPE